MIEKKNGRVIFVAALFAAVLAVFVIRLASLQLVNGEAYYEKSKNSVVKTTVVKASRGGILDRYLTPLVYNTETLSVIIDRTATADLNTTIDRLVTVFDSCGEKYLCTFPIDIDDSGLYYRSGYEIGSSPSFTKYLSKKGIDENSGLENIISSLTDIYKLDDYTKVNAVAVISVRYEIEQRGSGSFFTFAEDVDPVAVTLIGEYSDRLEGVYVESEPSRVYSSKGLASHILGTVGRIYAEEYETLKDNGYQLDDVVGKFGIEKICEKYLKGTNGIKSAVRDETGTVTSVLADILPVVGDDVILTLDSTMQSITESSLDALIERIRRDKGEDCGKAGAAVFLSVNTGEVLSMASWPTYDLTTYFSDYAELSQSETSPYLNRAISGQYAPGSTFKLVTAIAALECKTITRFSTRVCSGVYKFYSDYQPSCYHRHVHGTVNVIEALAKSCNIFFYDVGRMTGISNISKYAHIIGFGSRTGIDLTGEIAGTVASREYKNSLGQIWLEGEVLSAAIGQSDNAVTPLQLANCVAAIANGGKLYTPFIVKSVRDSETGNIIYTTEPQYVETGVSQETLDIVKEGMQAVVDYGGTAYSGFRNFRICTVACKTGTAEAGDSENILLAGYAPADNPEIAFAIVVEHGGVGTAYYCADVVKNVLTYYYSDSYGFDIIDKENTLLD